MPTFPPPITSEQLRLLASQLEFLQFVRENTGLQSIVSDLASQREQLDADKAAVTAGQAAVALRETAVAAEEARLAGIKADTELALQTGKGYEDDRRQAAQALRVERDALAGEKSEWNDAVALREQAIGQREINAGEREAACAAAEAAIAEREATLARREQQLRDALTNGH